MKRKADYSLEEEEEIPNLAPIEEEIPDLVPIMELVPDFVVHELPPLPPHLQLLSHILVTSHRYGSLYSFNDADDEQPVWSVFVTTREQFSFPSLQKFCKKTGFFCPRFYIPSENDVITLVYPRFETVSEFLRRRPSFIKTQKFKEMIKGIIQSLLTLQESKYSTWEITAENLVVLEDGTGTLLHMLSKMRNQPRSSKKCCDEFKKLKEVLDVLITSSQIAGCNLLGFKYLLCCMDHVDSREKAARLLRIPFFLCDQAIVRDFISTLHSAAENFDPFRAKLLNDNSKGWKKVVMNCSHEEAKRMLGKGSKYETTSDGVLKFCRNLVAHADQGFAKITKSKELSPLMVQPRRFLDLIQSLHPNFIDKVVVWSFQIEEKTIPILDY